jgi:hypothetical protein
MEVHIAPEVEKQLAELAIESGRGTDEVLEDALAGYFDEVARTRKMLDSRYDDLKSGRVKPIDGEEFFEDLRRNDEMLTEEHSRR